jgi:ADP-ribose pyrophosphatase YjhB (NUDIX family)
LYGKETKSHWLSVQGRTVLDQRSPPGGHVEFGESVLDTARCETMEEIGTEIENLEVWDLPRI